MPESRPGRRVAVVAGVRTPFAKSGTVLRDASATALARHAARELLYRSEIDGREIDEVIWGQVVPSVQAPNVGREVSLLPQLLPSVPAYTLNRACASGAQADHQRRRPDRPGPRRHHSRRRGRDAERHSHPPLPPHEPDPGGCEQGEDARRPGGGVRPDPPRRPGAGHPRDRRAQHRRDDGPERREDGQGERHHPRGAGRAGADEPSPGRGRRRRTGAWPPRSRPGSAARRWISR